MIKLMDMEVIFILMVLCILDTENKINSMDKVLRLDLIMLSIMEIMNSGRSRERVNFNELMVRVMKVIFMIITLMAMELISELMGENISDSEKIIKWKEVVYSLGLTEGNIQGNIQMTKKKDLVFLYGLMVNL